MGLASPDAESGDEIAVLPAGKVPFVVRKRGDETGHQRLIGETYVQSIMDGEVMKLLDEGKVKAEIIALC